MDEPTSAISESEVAVLFSIIERLRKENKIIVYISHKLDELFKIADRYIVMRDGKTIESGDIREMTHDSIIQKMVGRKINIVNKAPDNLTTNDELLNVNHLSLKHPSKTNDFLLRNISFRLGKGEILGIFGLMGAGRTELVETIFGLHSNRSAGNIFIEGKKAEINSPGAADDEKAAFGRHHQHVILLEQDQRTSTDRVLQHQVCGGSVERWLAA